MHNHPNTIINRDAEGYAHGYVEIWSMELNRITHRGNRWHGTFVRYNDWFINDGTEISIPYGTTEIGYVGVVEYFIT